MKTKSLFKSKTFWINLIMAILSFTALISPDLLTALGVDSTKALTIITSITALLNIVLRMLTNTGVAINPPNDTVPVG